MTVEQSISPEIKDKEPQIRLEFFRHDEKIKPPATGPKPDDNLARLTETGRSHATEIGKEKNPNSEVALSFGSPRERSQETSLRHMLAREEDITPEMSLEDIRAKIGEQLKIGRKDLVTQNLNFNWEGSKEFRDKAYKHYLETKDALVFLWKESDQLLIELNDKDSDSYSKFAGNIAELVNKYIKILPRWQQIVDLEPDKYEKFNNELQRFFGSHQVVLEPFLMKVIEKLEGESAVEEFVNSLDSKNGFGLSEGFSIDIKEEAGSPVVIVSFKDKQWKVSPEIILEIIKEKNDLNEKLLDLNGKE